MDDSCDWPWSGVHGRELRYPLPMLDAWAGKTALITGASSGIGAAVARSLHAHGLNVVACARRYERLTTLITSDLDRFLPVAADLGDEKQILGLFQKARDRFGGVDVLVNNAGLGHKAPLTSGATELWREMLEINVLALAVCTREAIIDMQKREDRGHIIHISSMSAYRVTKDSAMYSATKHAVRALTESLRAELRESNSKIRVSAVSPGFVETEFAEKYHRSKEAAVKTYTRYKVLEPKDIADAVCFILGAPEHMQVHDLLVRPTAQPS